MHSWTEYQQLEISKSSNDKGTIQAAISTNTSYYSARLPFLKDRAQAYIYIYRIQHTVLTIFSTQRSSFTSKLRNYDLPQGPLPCSALHLSLQPFLSIILEKPGKAVLHASLHVLQAAMGSMVMDVMGFPTSPGPPG